MVFFNFTPVFSTCSKFTPFSAKIVIFRGGVKVELDSTQRTPDKGFLKRLRKGFSSENLAENVTFEPYSGLGGLQR